MELTEQEEQRLVQALGGLVDRPKVRVTREVGAAELAALLVEGGVPVLVEDYISDRLAIVAEDQRFDFWKRELKPRLVEPHARSFDREGFPGERCYTALLCHVGSTGLRVVLCRMHH